MTSAMDHHIEDQEDKMRILFENDKEDLRENGISLERETELLIIEDLPSPIAMETTDFNCRSDETTSPEPDRSDKSRTETSQGTSEDLTIPSSPLTDECVSPLMEDSVFPPVEDSLSSTPSPLDKEDLKPASPSGTPSPIDKEELKPASLSGTPSPMDKEELKPGTPSPLDKEELAQTSDQVGEESPTNSDKKCEDSKPCSKEDSKGSELDSFSSSHSESDKVVEESDNSPQESSEIIKGEDDKSCVTQMDKDSASSGESKPITEDVTTALPPIMEEVSSNIPPVTGEVTSNIPSVVENNTSNLQPVTEEITSNLPPILEEVTPVLQPITGEVTANISPSTEENTLKPVNDIESTEDNPPKQSLDNTLSETKDDDKSAKTNDITTEDPVAVSSSEQIENSNGKKDTENPSKLTVDSVHVDPDSPRSADLPLTPGSQGSCDQPLTPSSVTTDFNSHEEVQSLQRELVQTHSLVKQLQAVILKERVKHSHNAAVLKMRLQQKEEECRKNATRSDKQLGEVIAHLLLLEGQLKKEHTQVRCKIAENENIIRKQEEDIESLTETNQRLLDAVREAYGRKGKNGIMLLDNLGDDKNGSSESLESPTSKSPPSVKSPHKGKWGSMKDKMTRKHRSSLDLSDTDFDVNRGLLVGRQYGSQESLLMIGRKSKEMREGRDKKCRSIAGYPDSSLVGLLEVPDENENRLEHSKVFGGNKNQCGNGQNSNMLQVSFNGIDQSSAGLLSAISMPILSQTDKNSNTAPTKERPKSISSIEHISSRDSGGTPDLPPQMESYPPPPKSPGATSNSSFSDSSNPFKNLKTILKRKGSKIKGKKRSVTMADAPSQDYQAAVKKHFEKYDMS